jgi:hypothetical protein
MCVHCISNRGLGLCSGSNNLLVQRHDVGFRVILSLQLLRRLIHCRFDSLGHKLGQLLLGVRLLLAFTVGFGSWLDIAIFSPLSQLIFLFL